MPATQLKDYYKILELDTTATEQEVKKAYRRLAMKYHPDTNNGDVLADSHFHEVKEAYDVLGNHNIRLKYDEERWLAGMTQRAAEKQVVTPMWILEEAIKLNNHMATVDVYRMNHESLKHYLLELLKDEHIALLQAEAESSLKESLVDMLLQGTKGLKYVCMQPIAGRLEMIADENTSIKITAAVAARKREAAWAKRQPYVIALITFIIVLCMYLWVKL